MKAYLRSKTLRYFPGWEKALKNPPLEPETPLPLSISIRAAYEFWQPDKNQIYLYINNLEHPFLPLWPLRQAIFFTLLMDRYKNINPSQEIHEKKILELNKFSNLR
jgi:hypothetical protein